MSENLLSYMVHFSFYLALGFRSSLHFNTCQLLPQRGFQKTPFTGLPSVSSLWPCSVLGKGTDVKVIYKT